MWGLGERRFKNNLGKRIMIFYNNNDIMMEETKVDK
jgi:hypothetical protein